MKVNSIIRVVLCSILGIFSSSTLLNNVSSSSLLDERADRPRSAREKHFRKLLARDPFTNTPDSTRRRQRSMPVLRIRGRTPLRVSPGEDFLPKFTRLPDVLVTCSKAGFVLMVKKSFYGFSAVAEELTLGETCKSNGVLEPHDDLFFTYVLTDCEGEQQVFPDYVAYKYVLHYLPQYHRSSLHYHRVNVDIECRFKRQHHVHNLAVSPTWRTPLHKVLRSRSGDFQIQLMDGETRGWISVFGQDSVCDCCDSVCNQTKTKRKTYEGFVSSDQVLFSDPVTSPLSTLASSTLDSTLIAHRNDVIWFEAKLAREPQRSYAHKDFVASVTLISSEDDHDKRQHMSQVSTVELTGGKERDGERETWRC